MSSISITLPFQNCIPFQLTGVATAPLVAGAYDFTALGKLAMSPAFSFNNNSLYCITDWTLFCYAPEAAWLEGIASPAPSVNVFMSGKQNAAVLEYPITMSKYYQQYSYVKMLRPKVTPNVMTFQVRGLVNQGPLLAAYAELKVGVALSLYEIRDPEFIAKYGKGST